jgi:hypothetical protein
LELAIGYGLIRESGGVLVDMRGQSLGEEKYLEYGQKDELPIIASSSEQLARELISRVK